MASTLAQFESSSVFCFLPSHILNENPNAKASRKQEIFIPRKLVIYNKLSGKEVNEPLSNNKRLCRIVNVGYYRKRPSLREVYSPYLIERLALDSVHPLHLLDVDYRTTLKTVKVY